VGEDRIKYKLLILPGYIVGLSCLLIITYRTFIAFFSESKSVLININKFGEQYFDLIALFIIWAISLIGLIVLFLMLNEEKTREKAVYKNEKGFALGQDNSFLDVDNKININLDNREIKGAIAGSVKNFDEEINLND
jgi:hypothetical protein